jgi:AcrR family transcriptional regulator
MRSRQDTLAVARQELAEHGLSVARVDATAARIQTTKRMIYYYFGSKEGFYLAVLEQVYSDPAVSSRRSILQA